MLTAGRGFVDLKANWPNATLEAECLAVKDYLPEALRGRKFYKPTARGYEKVI